MYLPEGLEDSPFSKNKLAGYDYTNLFGDPSSRKTSSIRLGPRSKGLKKSSSSLSLMEWYSCFSDLLSMAPVTEKRIVRKFKKNRNRIGTSRSFY